MPPILKINLLLGLLLPMIAGCDELQSDTGSEVIISVEKSEKLKKESAVYQIHPSTTRIINPDSGPGSLTPDAVENISEFLRHKVPDGPDENFLAYEYYLRKGNIPKAIEYLKLASTFGRKDAHKELAERYERGHGVNIDYKIAYLYFYLYEFQYIQFRSEIEKKQKLPALIENFREIEDRLGLHLSDADREWVQAEFDRHNDIFRRWGVERVRSLKGKK